MTIIRKLALTSPRSVRRLFGDRFFDGLLPEFLWLAVTDACPNRCLFCDIGSRPPAHDPLSPEEVMQLLRDPLFEGLRMVIVSGGEPTVRKDLPAILSAVHRARPPASVVLSTSAALPERLLAAVQGAVDAGMRLQVGVSLDGLGARHDLVRGTPGLFTKVDRALGQLADLRQRHPGRLHVSIGFVLCDATLTDLEGVRDYARSRGFELNVQWYNQGSYYGNEGRMLLSPTAGMARAARALCPTPVNDTARRLLERGTVEYRCTTLHNACLVKSNGDLVPCFAHWNEAAGNLRHDTPSAVWQSPRARQLRAMVRDCQGCLNSCGVLWSHDANHLARLAFFLRHRLWPGNGEAPPLTSAAPARLRPGG